jgi:hypothetical protein
MYRFFTMLEVIGVCLILLPTRAAHAAAPQVFVAYRTDSAIIDNKATYGNGMTRFAWIYLGVDGGNPKNKGTFEIKDTNYTFGTWNDWKAKKGTSVENENRVFDLVYMSTILGSKNHSPANKGAKSLFFTQPPRQICLKRQYPGRWEKLAGR